MKACILVAGLQTQRNGGELFLVHRDERNAFNAQAGANQTLNLGESLQLFAEDIGENAIYNWYDSNDSLIYIGKDTTLTPINNESYVLEIIAHSDGFKDYSTKNVIVKEYYIESAYPSPNSTGTLTIKYEASQANLAHIEIVNASNNAVQTINLNVSQNLKLVNLVPMVSGTVSPPKNPTV